MEIIIELCRIRYNIGYFIFGFLNEEIYGMVILFLLYVRVYING